MYTRRVFGRLLPFVVFLFLIVAGRGLAVADPSAPDSGFGGDGVVIADLGGVETGGAVVQLSSGKLLLLGNGSGGATGHSLTRYNGDGSVDTGYGTGGTAAGHSGSLRGFSLLAGDELLVAGDYDTGSLSELNDAAVMRYTATGAKDNGFGSNGRVTFRFDPDSPADEHATNVIELASGKLLVCGYLWRGGGNFDVAVVRLSAAGAIDTGFGDNGYFTFDYKGGVDKAWQVYELAGGRLIVYGEVQDTSAFGAPTKVLFMRLDADGAIDTSFGGSGTGYATIITDVNSDSPGAMVPLANGKFLFAVNGTAKWTAARLNADGTLDASFGAGGVAGLTPVLAGNSFPAAQSVGLAVQADGRVVVGGWVAAFSPSYQLIYDIGLARFNPDGSPDTSFNSGSAQRTYTITEAAPESATNVIVQSDGKIVLGGYYPNGSDDRFMLRVTGDPVSVSSTTSTSMTSTTTVTTTTSTTTTSTTSTSATTSTTMPCPGGPGCDLCGDATGDGKINASDALAALRAAVHLELCVLARCDVDGNGSVLTSDALRILQFAVGAPVLLSCGP